MMQLSFHGNQQGIVRYYQQPNPTNSNTKHSFEEWNHTWMMEKQQFPIRVLFATLLMVNPT